MNFSALLINWSCFSIIKNVPKMEHSPHQLVYLSCEELLPSTSTLRLRRTGGNIGVLHGTHTLHGRGDVCGQDALYMNAWACGEYKTTCIGGL